MPEESWQEKVFAVPAGVDFSDHFAKGLQARLAGAPPEAVARVRVFVNSGRMARAIEAALRRNGVNLLPKIGVVTDIPDLAPIAATLPPPVPPLRRQLMLARAVGALLRAEPHLAPQSARFALAGSLAALMDELQSEGVDAAALEAVDVGEHAAHWQTSLAFLRILRDHWDASPGTDPQDRFRRGVEALCRRWADHPPQDPVIVAGSTGSRGATLMLMQAVARLPRGAVVLPGWDPALPAPIWARLDETGLHHPQAMLKRTCAALGVAPDALTRWGGHDGSPEPRNKLISLALRPAPFTDQWLEEGPALGPELAAATEGLSLLEAETPREEALALALCLRAAAELGETARLVTADRTLARRVSATLARWGMTPDDSAGRPLGLTPPGTLARLVLAAIGAPLAPETLVALLKHPLTGSGETTGAHRLMARRFEIECLRAGASPWVDVRAVRAWADNAAKDDPFAQQWSEWILSILEPLASLGESDLTGFVTAHRHALARLAGGPSGGPAPAWDKEDERALLAFLDELEAEASAADITTADDYRALFETVLAERNVTALRPSHPSIALLGTLEARVAQADLTLLGGLNDETWPGPEPPDPWLNRDMRRQIGLATPEKLTGLSAHDFQQAASGGRVVLSRAKRNGEAPTVASRWLERLTNLLAGLGPAGAGALERMRARGGEWLALARAMDRPCAQVPPAPRPAPCPPPEARLSEISVTQVEQLIRDAYAIYARRILDLRKLDPLGQTADALLKGNVLHGVMERFNETWPDALPADPVAALLDLARAELEKTVPWRSVRLMWLARLERVAPALMADERLRRARGRVLDREVWGERWLDAPPFRLFGKADRIDLRTDGTLAIYDYKTGALPTKKQRDFFQKQLPLEAAIAEAGGFEGVPAAPVTWLEFIGLSPEGLKPTPPKDGWDVAPREIAQAWEEFGQLIAAWSEPDRGFAARMSVADSRRGGDYDHLARYGEWWDTDEPTLIRVP